jgi:HSP20 family protein
MGPSIRYINQTAPFWDFIHNMEDQANEHPLFNQGGPWAGPRHSWGNHGMPHRGPNAPAERTDGEEANKEATAGESSEEQPKQTGEGSGCAGRRGKGRCGGGGRAWRHGHGHGPYGWGPHARGGFGGPWGVPRGFGFLSDMFQTQEGSGEQADWKPEVDVFDTETSYVVHFSLPGANKEDIGVSWDPEKSELTVAGVVYRPGDEEFLKKLALEERKAGAFERKVRLGTRTSPAHVDVEGISAKLDNGILIVDVPKMKGDFVDVKKVDIE